MTRLGANPVVRGGARIFVLIAASSCGALASSPPWVGGGMAVSAPAREAEETAQESKVSIKESNEPKQIAAKHILVMHTQSKSKPEGITRSRDEARQRAQECLKKIRGGADFDEMVKEYSDEPGAAERGGDLGQFDRSVMIKQFSDAAFALKVGEVSEIVETPFGFHIIKRTE